MADQTKKANCTPISLYNLVLHVADRDSQSPFIETNLRITLSIIKRDSDLKLAEEATGIDTSIV